MGRATVDATNGTYVKTPMHLWIVGVLSLLWNSFGCYDYTMTQTRNAAYLAQFPPEVLTIIESFPIWASAAWAFGVWGSLAGSILLLLRSRHAVTAFIVSLAGLAVSTLYQLTSDLPASMTGSGMMLMYALIWGALIAFLLYSMRMRRAGVLR